MVEDEKYPEGLRIGREAIERYKASLGLPPDATATEVEKAEDERSREKRAQELGLPKTATWEEIEKAYKRQTAEKLGLDSEASWYEIRRKQRERNP